MLQPNCFQILSQWIKKYRVACVTNGNSYTQNIKLDYTVLRKEVELVLVSADFEIHKPEKDIFLEAARRLKLNPFEIAFICDTFSTDILGSYRSNMMPVWFLMIH